jgi:hypothetical protein
MISEASDRASAPHWRLMDTLINVQSDYGHHQPAFGWCSSSTACAPKPLSLLPLLCRMKLFTMVTSSSQKNSFLHYSPLSSLQTHTNRSTGQLSIVLTCFVYCKMQRLFQYYTHITPDSAPPFCLCALTHSQVITTICRLPSAVSQ